MINNSYITEILGDEKLIRRRIFKNNLSGVLISISSLMVVVPLVFILFYLLVNGIPSINADFLTKLPKPVGESGGGISNAIAGSTIFFFLLSLFPFLWQFLAESICQNILIPGSPGLSV